MDVQGFESGYAGKNALSSSTITCRVDWCHETGGDEQATFCGETVNINRNSLTGICLLYTSDAADE